MALDNRNLIDEKNYLIFRDESKYDKERRYEEPSGPILFVEDLNRLR